MTKLDEIYERYKRTAQEDMKDFAKPIPQLIREIKNLRFFHDEVLGLFDWGDEEAEMGLDPLTFVRERLADERKWAKIVAKKYAELERLKR